MFVLTLEEKNKKYMEPLINKVEEVSIRQQLKQLSLVVLSLEIAKPISFLTRKTLSLSSEY